MIVLVQEMDIWKNKHAKNIKKKHEKMTEKTLLVVETIQEVASPRIYFLDPAIYAIYG